MRELRAVLDTNVVVSAHLKSGGREALILELALANKFRMVASEALLEEYEGVLRRPRFGLTPEKVTRSLAAIRRVVLLVSPQTALNVTGDPDDNRILECALEGGAAFVVTGNVRHFPTRFRGTNVVPSRQFLAILAAHLE